MINLIQNHQKNIILENADVKFFLEAEYKAVQDNNLPYSTQFHTHSYVELFACLAGEIRLRTHEEVITLATGDVAAVPSSVYHFKEAGDTSDTKWYAIGVICRELYTPHSNDVFSFFSDIMESDIIRVYRGCHKLCSLFADCSANRNLDEISSILSITAELLKLPRLTSVTAGHTNNSRKAKNIDRLLKLENIINTNFYQSFSNKEIADSLFISERQLSRIVAENYSTSLRSLFVKKRIEVAAELLRTKDLGIEKIAASVGFKNKNSFNREFKKQYSVTPSQYRVLHGNKKDWIR